MFVGTALFAYYNSGNAVLPEGINPDAIFPHFIINVMPVGVTGLILSVLIAAAISSLDSDINCLSAVGVEDFYCKIKPKATDAEKLKMGKTLVVASGIAALGIASLYVIMDGKGVLGIVFTLYAIFSGGIAGIFLIGIFSKRVGKKALNTGIAFCVAFTAYALLSSYKIGSGENSKILLDLGPLNYTHHKYMLGVYSHILLMVVSYLASFFYKEDKVDEKLTIYTWINKFKK